jgi:hypothetical protein
MIPHINRYKYRDYATAFRWTTTALGNIAIIDEAGSVVKVAVFVLSALSRVRIVYLCAVGEDMPRWAQVDWITWCIMRTHPQGAAESVKGMALVFSR